MTNHHLLTDADLIRAVCDTLVPGTGTPDAPTGSATSQEEALLAVAASDLGIDAILVAVLPTFARHVRDAVAGALAALGEDFVAKDPAERARRWRTAAEQPETRFGAFALQSTATAMFYTAPDATGQNPTWPALGFPGPLLQPPSEAQFPKTLSVAVPEEEISADVIVVGSGAGGGVAAAVLAEEGLSVLVLERGGYRNEPDLPQLEAMSFPNLYLGGGFIWSENGSAGLLAGATVGGGTTVNSMACLPTPDQARSEWAAAGMVEVEDAAWDEHVAAVMRRINATPENSRFNSVNKILVRGLEARGVPHALMARNARDADDRFCGSCNSGCLVGCKQSTMKTFLQDASDAGAVLVPNCTVEQILTEDGVATGVRATVTTAAGEPREVVMRAPRVVIAAGALSTPLLLQASGIGGPAVGHNLHVHPSYFMSGVFPEQVEGWQGQILTAVTHQWTAVDGVHGFVVEAAPMGLGFWSGFTGWHDGEQHKRDMLRFKHVSGVWGFVRDHGGGTIERDDDGRPLVSWDIDDDVDLAVVRRCHAELARTLEAAGAEEIFTFLPGDPRWRRGEDFEAFVATLMRLEKHEVFTLSAHQSGTCATGLDPTTSVVDGQGQLHDVHGVYVADASALPTAPGVNPMISIEAFARRTARFVAASLEPTSASR
jgi:choline dehydrogenase-like flavoprotein